MNISAPVAAVKAKAAHVHFSMSDAIRLNDSRVDATPSNRRSTIAIVPKTIAKRPPAAFGDSPPHGGRIRFLISMDLMSAASAGSRSHRVLQQPLPSPTMGPSAQCSGSCETDLKDRISLLAH